MALCRPPLFLKKITKNKNKMIQKIYGVSDLKDWMVNIRSGKLTLRVSFSGGATTARGRVPATYSTSDPVKQAIIEKSDYFKYGRIYVVQQMNVPDDAEALARKKRNDIIANRNATAPVVEAKPEPAPAPEAKSEVQEVEVADKAEAVEWLKEHNPEKGYTAFKLRGKEAFEKACNECNVVFKFG